MASSNSTAAVPATKRGAMRSNRSPSGFLRDGACVASGDLPVPDGWVMRSRSELVTSANQPRALEDADRGCTVDVHGERLVCPCHGSTYNRSGEVLKGPAQRALQRYAVARVGDTLTIEL